METYGFFNGVEESEGVWDRVYTAEQFAEYFGSFISNGVFKDLLGSLAVTQADSTGMSIKVAPGRAFINGFWYFLDEAITLPVPIASAGQSRTDMVVIRLDRDERTITAKVIQGGQAPVRNEIIYDLMLCTINIPANSTAVYNSQITDTRPNADVCGWVGSLIAVPAGSGGGGGGTSGGGDGDTVNLNFIMPSDIDRIWGMVIPDADAMSF